MKEQAHSRDRGMTLVELIITITIIALIATALTASVSVILRSDTETFERINESRDLQQLATYFPADVRSTPAANIRPGHDSAGNPINTALSSGCASGNEGTNMLHLTFVERIDGVATTHRVSYRVVDGEEPGVFSVQRWACRGPSAANLGAPTISRLAIRLARRADNRPDFQIRVDGGNVELSMTLASGRFATIDTGSRNPNETLPPPSGSTLPPLTLPPVDPTTTTTEPTTTTTDPSAPTTTIDPSAPTTTTPPSTTTTLPPCTINSWVVQVRDIGGTTAYRTNTEHQDGRDRLVYPVDVWLTGFSGNCTELWAQWTPGNPAVVRQPMTPRGENQFSVTVPADIAERWTDPGGPNSGLGPKSIAIFDVAVGGTALTTISPAFNLQNCGGNC